MKTLILYATKHGAAREIAERIADKMEGAVICDLKQSEIPEIKEYDCLIIGSSVYAGFIRKEAKVFMLKNKEILKEKKLGLFLCGLGANGVKKYFKSNFPKEILQAAITAKILGGIYDPKKAGAMERFIMRIITKQSGYINTISNERIEKFAETIKSGLN